MGAQVTTASSTSITGVVTTQRNANVLLVIILMFLCLVPGIVYLVVARKTVNEPFSAQLGAGESGTYVTFAGQGRGRAVIAHAVASLPV
ncbi:MAG: hypothetical protein ACRD03_01585 [Acidimicrobiales bacterium]